LSVLLFFTLALHGSWYGCPRRGRTRSALGAGVDRRAGPRDLSPGRGGGRLRAAHLGQEGRPDGEGSGTHHALGDDPGLPEADGQGPAEAPRPQGRPCRQSAAAAGAHRPPRRTHARHLPVVSGAGHALSGRAHPVDRRHSRRHHPGGDRAYDPSLLVPAVPADGGAPGARRPARRDAGLARPGAVGLAALRPGQHAGPGRRSLQLPPAAAVDGRRAGPDVVPTPGGPVRLVRADPGRGPRRRRAARRRDRLAGRRQDLLAVVLHDGRPELLPHRPLPRQPGAHPLLQDVFRRHVGVRLLGRLQRGCLRGGRSACRTCCAS
jgi:hypothetical protein